MFHRYQLLQPDIDLKLLVLPPDTNILSIFPHGNSYWCGWTRTSEIRTEQADGSELSFFLKVCIFCPSRTLDIDLVKHQVSQTDAGKAMVAQEYLSMKTLHEIVPHLTPKPIACGTYAANSKIHFFVSEFVEMTDDAPDPSFMASLADLHTRGLSPNDKYGFSIPTFQRAMPQYTEWTDSWEEFFTKSIERVFEFEERTHGPDDELKKLEKAILEKVVPNFRDY